MTNYNDAYDVLKWFLIHDAEEQIDAFFRDWDPDKGYKIKFDLDIDRDVLDRVIELEGDLANEATVVPHAQGAGDPPPA